MNDFMQIETSSCNTTNVASHISQATASSVISENVPVGPSITIAVPGGPTIIPGPNSGGSSTISLSAPPMVFTVNAQQSSAGAPVLKLVSPVEGGAPQLIKVVPASAFVNPTAPIEQADGLSQIATSSATTTIYQNTGTVAVVQKMNDGQSGQNQSAEGNVVSQRVYSIVPANQQKPQSVVTSAVIQKTQFNNGQQRIHTLPAQLTNARVVPASSATVAAVGTAGTQKLQILSNVVVSKQNIVLNKPPLQAQRQIITSTMAQKANSNLTKTVVTSGKPPVIIPQTQPSQQQLPPKIQSVNNVVLSTNPGLKPVLNNFPSKALKTVTAMNRPALQIQQPGPQQQKTIKTLSPGSPQPGFAAQKPTGIKTLSPSVANHFNNKLAASNNKIASMGIGGPPASGPLPGGRIGIKTLGPQKPPGNNRNANLGPKPNYIGKHANQAQKVQHHKNAGSGLAGAKARNAGPQRINYALLSPTKNNNQKATANSQSNYNQALTAQILQSLPSAGPPSTTKMYPLQTPPDETSLSEDIGEEVPPGFSSNLSFLYQVVMLDHNYGAPPPGLSPPPPMPRASALHHSPGSVGLAVNGALLAAVGREREKEREREVLQMNATSSGFYTSSSSNTNTGKRGHNRHNNAQTISLSLPPSHLAPVITNIVPSMPIDNRSVNLSSAVEDDDVASTISSEGGRGDEGDEGEETETAPEGEGDEDGITRCICDFVHDDGYMICCDVCSSWQHIVCMGIDKDQIPEKYSCVRCLPRRVDRQQARSIQLKRLKELPPLGAPPPAPPIPPPEIRPVSGNTSDTGSDTSTAESTGESHHPPHYGRQQPTGKLSLNNNLIRKKRNTPVPLSTRRKSEPAARRTPLQKRQQRRESARETSTTGRRTAMKKREKNKVMKRKMKSRSSVDDDSQDSWHGVASAYSNSMGASVVQLRQWIENYEEAVTNHYSPELRARITNMRANGSHITGGANQVNLAEKQAPPTAQADVAVQKCRVGNQPLSGFKIVLATQTLISNAPVIELRGKYMLSTQHRTASGAGSGGGAGGGGLQTRQHSQRPGPFLFFYRLPRDGTEVCVDTRTYGNDARFIRRSCRPNAELRHLVEKGTLHLYVITTNNVDKNIELTIKHESHDLAAVAAAASSGNNLSQATAAVAAAGVPCACGGGPQTCGLYNSTRKNGGVAAVSEPPHTATNTETTTHRKRRGRRASTPNRSETPPPPPPPPPPVQEKEKDVEKEASPSPVPPPTTAEVLQIVEPAEVEEKPSTESVTPPTPAPPALSTRRASSNQRAAQAAVAPPPAPVTEIRTRSTSEHSVEREPREVKEVREPREGRETREERKAEAKDKKKKLTREERKMEAIMKAFERMEKAQQRKQEVQARQAQRRESDPIPSSTETQQQEAQHKRQPNSLRQENGEIEREIVRTRRKKRKGRARTISTNSQQSTTRRRTRVNSTDSYITSGDDSSLLSPPLPASTVNDTIPSPRHTRSMSSQERHSAADNSGAENLPRDLQSPEPVNTVLDKFQNTPGSQISDISSPGQVVSAAGMLLSLANGGAPGGSILVSENKSPEDGNSSGSNSSLQSSPNTPLSSACLLVAAAVGPLEPGFKFPKTKKAIMNEWLNKPSDPMPTPASAISPSSLHVPVNNAIMEPLSNDSHVAQPQSSMEYYSAGSTANKSLATLVQAATLCDSPPQAGGGRNLGGGQGAGNAKKRWLRQAISEECDSPCSRPESPPGAPEMVAPPKKRRLARESLSSEQSFTPPTTPTMLVPPSNSLADEDYPNNDEEFYTNEDRNQNLSDSSPPTTDDSGKEPIVRTTQRLSNAENIYTTGGSLGPGDGYQHRGCATTDDLAEEMGLKDRVSDLQIDFGNIKQEEKKYPESLPSSLLDPRLGRDSRPIFRDSAQLLGTVEKTIRFYEENLTGPVTAPKPIADPLLSPPPAEASPIVNTPLPSVVLSIEEQVNLLEQPTVPTSVIVTPPVQIPTPAPIQITPAPIQITPAPVELIPSPKVSPVLPIAAATPPPEPIAIITPPAVTKTEKSAPKPEMVTPAKRKLSISEYRQRKQLKPGSGDRNSGATSPERANSPETPPPSVSNILTTITSVQSTNSVTASTNPGLTSPSTIPATRSRARSRSASSSSSTSSLSSDEESIAGAAIIESISDVKISTGVEPQLPMAFNSAPTAVERQRENVERLKKALGLAMDDETRKNAVATITRETSVISPKAVTSPIITAASSGKIITSPKIVKAAPPTINPALTTSDLLAKISEGSITTKLMMSLETTNKFSMKRPKSPTPERDRNFPKRGSPERVILKNPPSPEPAKSRSIERELELIKSNNKQNEDLGPYTKFQENVTTSFIPPFNNPVYPNSAQFTGFSSVIDSSPYEGRNPSPPPSELLKQSPYSLKASKSSLTMSPSKTGYK